MPASDICYIPLHLHSDYSILDGLQSVEAIVKRAQQLKIPALALTDLNNICGFIKFYSACRNAGIKPIMGADLMCAEPQAADGCQQTFRLTALAMNRQGKQNLYDLLSIAWLRSDAGAFNAAVRLDELAKYSEGLILLDGFRGDIAAFNRAQDQAGIAQRTAFYQEHFPGRFCLEITRTGRAGESEFERCALDLCLQYGLPPAASNDSCFLYGPNDIPADGFSDYEIHDVRVSIQRGCQRGNKEVAREYSPQQYFRTPEEMAELFADLPEALTNTRCIAERCNVTIELDHPRLPHYPTGNLSPADCLRQKAHEGLDERLAFLFPDEQVRAQKRPIYEQRLETELDVIIKMDFPGYFLIVMEFIQWSKDHGVPVGPGRGSGGGSLVAYSLKITDFDPLQFDLLFERFLNPERVSMPDFDVDFCQRRREKTLDHVREHYGANAVSQIAAFGTMAAKAAIKDTGRALGMTYGAVDYVAKLLPTQPGLTFRGVMGRDKKGNPCESEAPDFLALYEQAKANDDKQRVELIHIAMRLEGVIRNIGKHAAGVVISPTRTAEFAPLMLDSDGNPITQFDKKDVEHAGLVKFDFLGLTTLTIIDDALTMINEKKQRLQQSLLDIHAIPYADPDSFAMLQQGHTTAVFQLESAGMRKLIGQMQPDRFDDLIALVALYRPGPIKSGMVDHFVQRKHGREEVSYPSPDFQDLDLKPILDSTYGVIVYQEQVMQIAQVLAGYSLGGADILRRAMGKKNPAEMAGQRSVFKEGAIKKGKDPVIAMKIFDQVEMFAEYGFNKSHSAAYALVAWWTLWLKVHYPAEFLAAMMTADRQRTEKLVTYIAECRRLKIKVNPPDVLTGRFDFCVNEAGEIVYGIGAVKGVGEDFCAHLVKMREEKGTFTDFYDFVSKIGSTFANKKNLEALIMSGALDKLCPSRAQMLASIPNAIKYAQRLEEDADSGQMDLFAALTSGPATKPELVKVTEFSDNYRLSLEKGVLGLYLSGHPINAYKQELAFFAGTHLDGLRPGSAERPVEVTVCGAVINLTEKISKNDGHKFYIITIDDSTSQLELSLFSRAAEEFSAILAQRKAEEGRLSLQITDADHYAPAPLIIVVRGWLSQQDGSPQPRLRVQELMSLEQLRRENASSIIVKLDESTYREKGERINALICQHLVPLDEYQKKKSLALSARQNPPPPPQGCRMQLLYDGALICFNHLHHKIDPSDFLIDGIRDLAGTGAVTVNYSQAV